MLNMTGMQHLKLYSTGHVLYYPYRVMLKDIRLAEFLRELPRTLFTSIETGSLVRNAISRLGTKPGFIFSIGKAAREMRAGAFNAGLADVPAFCVSPSGRQHPFAALTGHQGTAFESGHPFPDEMSFQAARAALSACSEIGSGMHVLALISGGASALFELPLKGLSGADLRASYVSLVSSGRTITEMNTIRRHLSGVKGGNLLRILLGRGATVTVLALSDVPGDQPHDIGSGPFSPDPTRFSEALETASAITGFPVQALRILESGSAGMIPETLKPECVPAGMHRFHCIMSPSRAARELATLLGATDGLAHIGKPMSGSRLKWLDDLFSSIRADELPDGVWLIASGELEVPIPPGVTPGRGGRATSLVLDIARRAAAESIALDIAGIATDGADGNSASGGGFLTAEDLKRFQADDLEAAAGSFDSATWLAAHDRLYEGFPTGTNLGDILLLRLRPREASR